MIRLGLVGLGHISQFQRQALALLGERFVLSAACDLDPTRQTVVPGVPFFADYHDFLARADAEAVLIATPSQTHYTMAKAALESGRHLLLEKPAAGSLAELDELIALARRQARHFVVALHSSFGTEVRWFAERYPSDHASRLGPLTSFRTTFYDPYIIDGAPLARSGSLGGSWPDSGINALSLLARFLDMERVTIEDAALTSLPQFPATDIRATVGLRFSTDGTNQAGRGLIETNWTQGVSLKISRLHYAHHGYEIILHHTDQQVWEVDPLGQRRLLHDGSATHSRQVNHYLGVLEDFARHLDAGTDNSALARALHAVLFQVVPSNETTGSVSPEGRVASR